MSADLSALGSLVYGVWALMPEQLIQLQAIYEARLRGETLNVRDIEAQIGRPLANQQRSYEVIKGVGVLTLQGAISPKANMFTQVSGGASAQLFVRDLNAAANDSSVQSLIIAADTPGGNVLGIPAARDAVRAFGARKPIVTHSDGVLASAGYWIGAAANRVYIADSMVQVGSIGVVYTHTDTSQAENNAGLRKTVISSGKFKRLEGADGRLTEAGRETLQEKADYVYSVFVGNVAQDRGVGVSDVLEHMADGRVFIGQQAKDAGLVDGFSSLGALISAMAKNPADFAQRRRATVPQRPIASPAAPAATSAPPRQLTQHEKATQASAHAKQHGIDFIASYKALGFDRPSEEASAADKEARTWQQVKEERVAMANEYAKAHGVRFVTAFKALGFDKIGSLR